SEELAATAEEMSAQAELLNKTMAYFKLGTGQGQSRNRSVVVKMRSEGRAKSAARAPVYESEYVQFEG
ncbi:MAG TPA: methyl-accepting chemotaxis protein, partial [Accumulibacter sp.]|nr:methyl-accepting chemotaxis protein [Accumulibacter sp.]